MRIILCTCLALASTAHAAKWTVLSYFAADNNLEKPMIQNVVEMTQVGSSADVNIVLQLDRGFKNADAMMATFPGGPYYSGVKRFLIQKDNAMEVGNLGDVDMRQASTLSDFIKWGVATYPADHYAVILSDHGGAWVGCCNDDSLGPGLMDLAAITAGVQGGGVMIDVLGFDECLMANLEVAWALRGSAKVLVASEEEEPGAGWDWAVWLQKLSANPDMDGVAIGTAMSDGFLANIVAKAPKQAKTVTLSVVDLSQVTALGMAANKVAETVGPLVDDPVKWRQLAQARNSASKFAAHGQGDEGLTIDLGEFATAAGSVEGAAAATSELNTALAAAVKYKVAGADFQKAGGLSIYLPLVKGNAKYLEVAFAKETKWGPLVVAYAITAARDTTKPMVQLTVTPMGGGRSLVQAMSGDDDLARLNTTVATADGTFLGELPAGGGGTMDQMFDGQWPALSDGTSDVFAPLFATAEGSGSTTLVIASVDVDVDGSGNFVPGELRMEIDPVTKMGDVVGVFDSSEDEVAEFDLSDPKARIRPRKVAVADGDFSESDGEVTLAAASLVAKPMPIPSDAQLGVHASDYAGNDTVALVSATMGGTVTAGGPHDTSSGCSIGGTSRSPAAWLLGLLVIGFVWRRRARR